MNGPEVAAAAEALVAAMLVAGGLFTLVGSIGLLRLRDVFQRMHAPTKATTLGVGCILIAAAVASSLEQGELSLHEFLIAAFLFVTAPVSAYLVARVALHQGLGERTGLDHPGADLGASPASGAGEQGDPGPSPGSDRQTLLP